MVNLNNPELREKLYIAIKPFFTIRKVTLIEKKEFATTALDQENDIFVVHVMFFAIFDEVYSSHKAQKVSLKVKEALTTIFLNYSDFVDVSSPELVAKLLEQPEINNYTINLVKGKRLLYGPIYNLRPVELKILKTYIEINLANSFIKLCKYSMHAGILFV